MNRDQAAQLLNITLNAKRGEVDTAFTSLRLHFVNQLQFSVHPHERDAAVRALALIQEAYTTLTGQSAPSAMPKPKSATHVASEEIPRVSLGGRHVAPKRGSTGNASSPAGRSLGEWLVHVRGQWSSLPNHWKSNRETAVALAICAGIILIAILMLALSG